MGKQSGLAPDDDLMLPTLAFPHALRPALLALGLIVLFIVLNVLVFHGVPDRARGDQFAVENTGHAGVGLDKILDYKIKDYKANLGRFDANLKLQGAFIVISVLLLIRRSDSLDIFGNKVPLQWLHVFVPLVMLYLWLSFGFLFDDLIEARIRGVAITQKLAAADERLAKSLFHDAGIIDGWVMTFVDRHDPGLKANGEAHGDVSGINHNFQGSTAVFLVLVLGTLISGAHACVLTLVAVGCRRYLRPLAHRRLWAYYLLPLVPLAIFLASHTQFAYGGHNRNWLQLYISFATVMLYTALLWVSLFVGRRLDPFSVLCLMRQRSVKVEPERATAEGRASGEHVPSVSVSLIGDSLCTSFHVSSMVRMLPKLRGGWRNNWFIGMPTRGRELESIVERLGQSFVVHARNHATPRAKVDGEGFGMRLIDWVTGTWHFPRQVDEVVTDEFPDLLLLWIGHNNIDAAVGLMEEREMAAFAGHFVADYAVQLRRLECAASRRERKSLLIVFGLVNFRAFFAAREQAERKRRDDCRHYPYLEHCYRYYPSMRQEYRHRMIKMADACNRRLQDLCESRQQDQKSDVVRVVYSPAMAEAPINAADMLHAMDAWHPSQIGHKLLAQHAYATIVSESSCLGWELH